MGGAFGEAPARADPDKAARYVTLGKHVEPLTETMGKHA